MSDKRRPAAGGPNSGSGAGLTADLEVRRGEFRLRAALTVAPGETLGVVGPNGAGKTTLLAAVAGTLDERAGTTLTGSIAVGARELAALPAWRRRVGYVEQKPRLFPHLDAADNISFGLRAHGMRRRPARALAAEWLERVGLPGRDRARASELSGGQQQRVALARALAHTPEVVLLDEAFAALDMDSAAGLRELVRDELARLQVPALMVTHDGDDLDALADRVLALDRGQVVDRAPVAPDPGPAESGREVRGTVTADGGVVVAPHHRNTLPPGTEVILRVVRSPRAARSPRRPQA
ncbi:ABC transporter ATP-binding protein [Citricoccus sp. NR2]|uniref:ABC transporter ATP-binding protein n=1 Tax=Citricoccus sp. NR2 TaxID=3004095 RepID=UPI0022DDFEC8|nr:ATP-binding cassette domain-containing protein [Citricoccus sp. NR2]WBL19839.1 ATP-binding cassette domain-containing protein [Citricoccus sp. NR2]